MRKRCLERDTSCTVCAALRLKASALQQKRVRIDPVFVFFMANQRSVIPILGDAESDSWHHLIPTLDVVIEAVGGDIKLLSGTIFQTVSKAAQTMRPQGAAKLSYIYTSGTWVHGNSRTDIVSDTTPITNPVDLVSWRPAVEQLVVHDPVLNGIVIRPALLIGRSGSILASFFRAASEGKIIYPGTPGGRFATIHADDLADVYLRAAEKALIVGGQIFSVGNDFTESVDDFLQKLVKISGAKSYEYKEPSNGKYILRIQGERI